MSTAFGTLLLSLFLQVDSPPAGGVFFHDFTLKKAGGGVYASAANQNLKGMVLVFTCNHCPFARLYTERLNNLARTCDSAGIQLLAINAMDTLVYEDETLEAMTLRAKTEGWTFPYLQDADQKVAAMMGAVCTPQVFILWKEQKTWAVRYSGAIDSNGQEPELAESYATEALKDLLAGTMVRTPTTQAFGCRIYYRKNQP